VEPGRELWAEIVRVPAGLVAYARELGKIAGVASLLPVAADE
jgi:hypothetical protein